MLSLVLLSAALAICGAVPAHAALTPTITSYPASDPFSPESHPYSIAAGPDGQLWFTDPYQPKIGRMTTAGAITLQAPLPTLTFAYGIAAGGDGAMWFVSQNPSTINRIDAAGNILTKNLASATANPTHIVGGPEGALWFTEGVSHAIGRMPASTPLAVPDESRSTEEGPNAIAAGSDGNLWFTEYSAGKIGRMKPSGDTTYFTVPKGIENPEGIAAGPDGALWYTALNPPTVVRISTDGAQHPFPLPKEKLFPNEIAAGPDGALWFAASGEIGRITTGGEVEFFPLPKEVGLNYVTPGPDGNVWFTEQNVGRIGRITTPPNVTTVGAGDVNAGEAKVSGTVDGHSQPTDVVVEYGPTGGASNRSSPLHLAASAADQPVTIPLSRLSPSTTYRYRVVATNPTGSTSGAYAEFTTGPPPKCRITKSRIGAKGTLVVSLRCTSTSSISATARMVAARASAKKHSGATVYGRAHARVVKGKATLRIKPKKAARKQLQRHARLSIRLAMKLRGGGAITGYNKTVHVRRPKRPAR
jgi:virginiamycin B lyase